MSIPKTTVDFIRSLHTDELEISCELELADDKTKLELCELRLYTMMEFIDRCDTGRRQTALDKGKADKWRYEAKKFIKSNSSLPQPPNDNLFDCETIDVNTGKTKTFWSSDILTLSIYFTRVRLFWARINRALSHFSKSFLPAYYVYAGLSGAIELIFDFIVIIHATFFAKTRNEKIENAKFKARELTTKLTTTTNARDTESLRTWKKYYEEYQNNRAWEEYKVSLLNETEREKALAEERAENERPIGWFQRLKNVFMEGNRPTRMLNAFVWVSLNLLIGILFPTALLTVMILSVGGTVIDICIDTSSASYALDCHRSLAAKLARQNISLPLQEALQPKTENTSITKVLRMFSYSCILSLAMVFIIASPPIMFAVILLSAATLLSALELINFKLPSNAKNNIDKGRAVFVLAVMLAALALTVLVFLFPPAALVFTLPLLGATTLSLTVIGAFVAAIVGSTALLRPLIFGLIDSSWTTDRLGIIYDNVLQPIGAFFKNLFVSSPSPPRSAPSKSNKPTTGQVMTSLSSLSLSVSSSSDAPKAIPEPEYAAPLEVTPPGTPPRRLRSKSYMDDDRKRDIRAVLEHGHFKAEPLSRGHKPDGPTITNPTVPHPTSTFV